MFSSELVSGVMVEDSVRGDRPGVLADLLLGLNEDEGFVTFVDDRGCVRQKVKAMYQLAQRILGGLRSLGLQPGDSIILQLDQHHFIPAFWGCLLGGYVPLPMETADGEDPRLAARLHHAWESTGLPPILTVRSLVADVHGAFECHGETQVRLVTIEMLEEHEPETRFHLCHESDLAFLLMTPGFTELPRLVGFSHRTALQRINDQHQKHAGYHAVLHISSFEGAMGILSVFPQARRTFYVPETGLENSLIWLDIIDEYGIESAEMSDYAMSSLLNYFGGAQLKRWNLSCLSQIYLFVDALIPLAMRKFQECLSGLGLKPGVIKPVFALAEIGPITDAQSFNAHDFHNGSFLALGNSSPNHNIRVVNEKGCPMPDGEVGIIQVKGETLTPGYYLGPGHLQMPQTDDGWFETKTMGFLKKGCLTMAHLRYENPTVGDSPYDGGEVEDLVESIPGVRPGSSAVFEINRLHGASGDLVIFFTFVPTANKPLIPLIKEISSHVCQKTGICPKYLVPMDQGSLPHQNKGQEIRRLLVKRWKTGELILADERVDGLRIPEVPECLAGLG